ncbi:hypothetical protein HDV04_002271 [Boothiomyces sp. JEL0838]|nr:hypothetical protein HDV04_002271 [Boothiomyces sp. JEL0838]
MIVYIEHLDIVYFAFIKRFQFEQNNVRRDPSTGTQRTRNAAALKDYVFPFIYFMVRDFNQVPLKDIGFYVGLIAASFSFSQFISSMLWGVLSDKYGRRPILLIGLLGNCIFMIMFGLSKSITWAAIARMGCGLNANTGVAKSAVAEITDKSNHALAFSVVGFVWGLGMIVGPILGGYFVHPAETMPLVFGEYFKEYPYFLPCLSAAILSFIGLVIGYYYLPETSHRVNGYEFVLEVDEASDMDDSHSHNTRIFPAQCSIGMHSSTPRTNNLALLEESRYTASNLFNRFNHLHRETTTEIWDASSEGIEDAEAPPVPTIIPENGIGYLAFHAITGYSMLSFVNMIFDEIFNLWATAPIGCIQS